MIFNGINIILKKESNSLKWTPNSSQQKKATQELFLEFFWL
jgi:hypothetical protein